MDSFCSGTGRTIGITYHLVRFLLLRRGDRKKVILQYSQILFIIRLFHLKSVFNSTTAIIGSHKIDKVESYYLYDLFIYGTKQRLLLPQAKC